MLLSIPDETLNRTQKVIVIQGADFDQSVISPPAVKRARVKLWIPVEAVTPFARGEQRQSGKEKGGQPRCGDTLRRAFNSPFWPHILCTTSVKQEGLDSHQWCSRIVHWDLPGDPIEFEQREGSIARYASGRRLSLTYQPMPKRLSAFTLPLPPPAHWCRQAKLDFATWLMHDELVLKHAPPHRSRDSF